MKVFGLAGWSGGGKTTLMVGLLEELTARGFTVSTLKHAHHDFDIDHEGKDSFRHREADAHEVLIGSEKRWALMHELRGEPEPTLDAVLALLSPVDLVLIEGLKSARHKKIEVYRQGNGKPRLLSEDNSVVAVASDVAVKGLTVPCFRLDQVREIADFILDEIGLGEHR